MPLGLHMKRTYNRCTRKSRHENQTGGGIHFTMSSIQLAVYQEGF
jgi:hypothetical protein